MEPQLSYATREELWRLQESLGELSATQAQHAERMTRLEKRHSDDTRVKAVWGPSSPFTNPLGASTHHESSLNPAAEAFRNFDADSAPGLMSTLSLDNNDETRRGAASRANSVRFDESANNHYTNSSKQSIDLPARTGSGLGSHPMSERSLSHRSDGRGSISGFPRANSFGLESSRLLGSINNSPRVNSNPPPGFFILGPVPAIIRCWLTESFSNGSLLYAAVCSGSYASTVSLSLLQGLGIVDDIFEEKGLRMIKLPVYLTEAKVHQPSSRSASPAPQMPTLISKFVVVDTAMQDKSIQIVLGSDILRSHNADILFSQDKLMMFDDDRNQLSIPLVRPENDAVYKRLGLGSLPIQAEEFSLRDPASQQSPPGIIGRPGHLPSQDFPPSPSSKSPGGLTSAEPSEGGEPRNADSAESTARTSTDFGHTRTSEEARPATESEKFSATPAGKPLPGAWGTSWRSGSNPSSVDASAATKNVSTYSRPNPSRTMKILRPSKPASNITRTTSSSQTNGVENTPPRHADVDGKTNSTNVYANEPKSASSSAPSKSNPVGSASAFGWLNSGSSKRGVD